MPFTPEPAIVINEPRENRGEHATPTKAALRALVMHSGLSKSQCFKKLDIPPRTGYHILKTESSRRDDKFRTGRAPKIDRDTIEKMIKAISGRYSKRVMSWEALGQEVDVTADSRTIHRAMNRADYSKCRACQKSYLSPETVKKREIFAHEHGSWPMNRWKQVDLHLFT